MTVRKTTFLSVSIGLSFCLLIQAAAFGDDKATNKTNAGTDATNEARPETKSDTTKPMSAFSTLQAGFTLIDYGREQNDPTSLLIAARILGTTPVTELKHEPGEDNDKEGNKAVPFDDGASLTKQAQDLISEAQKMAGELPQSERAAVEALAKSTTILLKERNKGVVGGPGFHRAFIRPGSVGGPYVLSNVALTGNYTWFSVQSLNGVDLDIRVVGALTGIVYGQDNYPNANAGVQFNHLPVAIVNIFIENCSNQIGEFILTSN